MVSSFTFSNHIVLCHLHSATMLYFVIWHARMNHSHQDRFVRGAPDRRSPHFSTITTSHFLPKPVAILLPQTLPHPPPPFGSNPSSLPPTLCPRLPPTPYPPSVSPGPSGPLPWSSPPSPRRPPLPFQLHIPCLHWLRLSLSSAEHRCMRGAPDSRSAHFSTIATSHWHWLHP